MATPKQTVVKQKALIDPMYLLKTPKWYTDRVELPEDLKCPMDCDAPCCDGEDYCAFLEPQDLLRIWFQIREFMFEYIVPVSQEKAIGRFFTKAKRGKCIFRDQTEKTCRIWINRPRICEQYPFILRKPKGFQNYEKGIEEECPLYAKFVQLSKREQKKIIRLFQRKRKFTEQANLIYFEMNFALLAFVDSFKLYGIEAKRVPIQEEGGETAK